jgi:hypothetical protein
MATQRNDAPNQASTPEEGQTSRGVEGLDVSVESDIRRTANREELRAIGAEIESIKDSVAHIAEATSHYVKRRVAENSTDIIAQNPVRSALWAAFAGFLIGRLSR